MELPTSEADYITAGRSNQVRNGGCSVNSIEVESGILGMRDVGTALLMMDRSFIGRAPEPENMERAFFILKGIYEQRYRALSSAWFEGGEANA